MEHTFGWPKKEIVGILASGEDPVPINRMPIVSDYKICDFRLTEEGFFRRIEWGLQGKIPSFAKTVIKPDMLRFDEETSWLNGTATFKTELKPHIWRNKVRCIIMVQWYEDGHSKSTRVVDVDLRIRVPVIGKKLEHMIAEILKQNNEKYAVRLNESFSEMLG
ncbi:MAG: DUF2505 family protein [Deltaproteobacteria bacterium]|jgi:hypothetical protein|nr:DUF2505 family protein [Deltaproteobacteria bacterium]